MDFVPENSNKLQKMGLEEKISWAFNVFTLLDLEIFNSENVKIKEYVHTSEHYYITWFLYLFFIKISVSLNNGQNSSQLDQNCHKFQSWFVTKMIETTNWRDNIKILIVIIY